MISAAIKKFLSPKRIEQIRRFKNLQKSSLKALRDTDMLPKFTVQIGSTSFDISYISQIPLPEWRLITAWYNSMNTAAEKEQALVTLASGVILDTEFLKILSQPYMKSVINNAELYACLYGTALYANMKPAEAYDVLRSNAVNFPSVFNYILASRAALMMDEKEGAYFSILQEGLQKFPGSAPLQLSLAGHYYRTFQTKLANEALQKVDPGFLDKIRNTDVAGTAAGILKTFEKELEQAIAQKLTTRPKVGYGQVGDTYSETAITGYWNQLFYAFNFYTPFQHGWSNLGFTIEKIMQEVIDRDNSVKQVIDFGTFCANPLYRLSLKHPGLKCYGVDREVSTKTLNDDAYKNDNLTFIAGYITDVLPQLPDNRSSLLFHSRTATLIYPEQVKNIYKACAANGIKYIALFENFAISRTHLQYFDFNALPAEAVPYASVMIIHNYPKYLAEAGYEVIAEKRLPYADLLWHGKETSLGDAHGCIIARLKS